MRLMIAIALVLIVGQASADTPFSVTVFHDDERSVTCWMYWGKGGISCLADAQIQRQQTSVAGEDQPTPATTPAPRQHEERFQL